MIQLKKETIVAFDPFQVDRYLFVDNCVNNVHLTETQLIHVSIPAEFERFSKMLKMGVPMMAVRQKMLLEGMTVSDCERFIASRKNGAYPPPGPPPPPLGMTSKQAKSLMSTVTNTSGSLPFLADIQNGNFALKRMNDTMTNTVIKKDITKNKVLKGLDTTKMFHVTLDDILSAKANLGKSKHRQLINVQK